MSNEKAIADKVPTDTLEVGCKYESRFFNLVEGNGVAFNDKPQDAINPSHYKHNGIETIDYMKAVSTEEEFKGHLRLTAIKYISRLGKKDCPKQEIKKAIWYLNKLLEQYEAESNE